MTSALFDDCRGKKSNNFQIRVLPSDKATMHFSAFFFVLSALVITSLAMPAPETTVEALPVPATMAVAAEIPYQTAGPFAGVLPPNFAKVWVYTGLECGIRDGPSYNMNFISGQDRCIPFRNVGSIIAWYKSSIG